MVAAATGPVGATVGQIGKLKGCRVIGVAGGAEKCRHATEVLGFDVCLDHHAQDFAQQLAKACPQELIFIMKTSAEKYLMPFCRCSTLQRGFRFVAGQWL